MNIKRYRRARRDRFDPGRINPNTGKHRNKLQPATGEAPKKKLPEQAFQIIAALDAGTKAHSFGKTVILVIRRRDRTKIVREFHLKHFRIALEFRRQRTKYRIRKLIDMGICNNEASARKYLEENGWRAA